MRTAILTTVGINTITIIAAIYSLNTAAADLDYQTHKSVVAAITNPTNNQKLNIIGRWWMSTHGDGDHMSTTNPAEQPGGNYEGALFFLLHR